MTNRTKTMWNIGLSTWTIEKIRTGKRIKQLEAKPTRLRDAHTLLRKA